MVEELLYLECGGLDNTPGGFIIAAETKGVGPHSTGTARNILTLACLLYRINGIIKLRTNYG